LKIQHEQRHLEIGGGNPQVDLISPSILELDSIDSIEQRIILSNILADVAFPDVGIFRREETVFDLARCPHPICRGHCFVLPFFPSFGLSESPRFFGNALHIQPKER
jgi:hypothetical protein